MSDVVIRVDFGRLPKMLRDRPDETARGVVKAKDLAAGSEAEMSVDALLAALKEKR